VTYGPLPDLDPDVNGVLAVDVFPMRRLPHSRFGLWTLRRARADLRSSDGSVQARRRIARRYGATWEQLYGALRAAYGFSLRAEGLDLPTRPGAA